MEVSADRHPPIQGGLGGLFRIQDPRTTDQPTVDLWVARTAPARPDSGHLVSRARIVTCNRTATERQHRKLNR